MACVQGATMVCRHIYSEMAYVAERHFYPSSSIFWEKTALIEMQFIFLFVTLWIELYTFIYFYGLLVSPESIYLQIILLTLVGKGNFTYVWLFITFTYICYIVSLIKVVMFYETF